VIVLITAEAEADLEHIAAYVAEGSPQSPLKLIRELRDRCDSLVDAPRGYPLVPRYEQFGIRRRPFGNFLIFYRVGAEAIEIVHVLHGARNYEPLLFPEK
jgi:toxin ParE1/3/4